MVEGDVETASLIYKDKRISDVVYLMDEDYYELWEEGVEEYLAGNWTKAKEILTQSREKNRQDRPNQVILDYMRSFGDRCPREWKGHRDYNTN